VLLLRLTSSLQRVWLGWP